MDLDILIDTSEEFSKVVDRRFMRKALAEGKVLFEA